MAELLTFRTKMSLWLSSNLAHWLVIIGITGLTIWKDNLAYFLGITFVLLLLWARRWEWKYIGLTKPTSWGGVWLQAIVLSVILLIVGLVLFLKVR